MSPLAEGRLRTPAPHPAISLVVLAWAEPERGGRLGGRARRERHHEAGRGAAALAAAEAGTSSPSPAPSAPPAARRPDPPHPVPNAPWPHGIIGSIAHTDGCAAAAATSLPVLTALGIDVETVRERHTALFARMAHVGRPASLQPRPRIDPALDATLTWTIREAVYKCGYPLLGPHTPALTCPVRLGAGGAFTALLPAPRPSEARLPDPCPDLAPEPDPEAGPGLRLHGRLLLRPSRARVGALCWVVAPTADPSARATLPGCPFVPDVPVLSGASGTNGHHETGRAREPAASGRGGGAARTMNSWVTSPGGLC